jgi:hypothetical protein
MCTDKMAGGECTNEGEFACHDRCGDETGEHLGILTRVCRMSPLEAKHVKDSLLRGKNSAAANCANLDGGH